jgi:prepilin-type N-terminal cleavage/methylation domain-containing protein
MLKFLLFFYRKRSNMVNSYGLTLIELLAVLVIIGILAAIAVPVYYGLVDKTKKDVCFANSSKLERMYEEYLIVTGICIQMKDFINIEKICLITYAR